MVALCALRNWPAVTPWQARSTTGPRGSRLEPGPGWRAGCCCSPPSWRWGPLHLALQITLPQIWCGFQLVGDGTGPYDFAINGVVLASIMITISTLINAFGVKLMTMINSVGVFVELVAAVLLIARLAGTVVRGPEVFFDTAGFGEGHRPGLLRRVPHRRHGVRLRHVRLRHRQLPRARKRRTPSARRPGPSCAPSRPRSCWAG